MTIGGFSTEPKIGSSSQSVAPTGIRPEPGSSAADGTPHLASACVLLSASNKSTAKALRRMLMVPTLSPDCGKAQPCLYPKIYAANLIRKPFSRAKSEGRDPHALASTFAWQ